MFKILSWLPRVVDFTHRTVSIDARLRVLVPTHKDEKGADVYQSLVFNTNLFDPKTKSPVIEYPIGGDLVSSDGPIYLASSWNPKLSPDMPVEVEVTLGIEFDHFDIPEAPAEAPKQAWEPKVGDWVTITKPTNLMEFPGWHNAMDKYLDKPHKIHSETAAGNWNLAGENGFASLFCFNPKWLSPWEPKVGDWVTITKPEDTMKEPGWVSEMDVYLGKTLRLTSNGTRTPGCFYVEESDIDHRSCRRGRSIWTFHKDWMTPAQPKREDWVSAQ
jgi:hypothetical protein